MSAATAVAMRDALGEALVAIGERRDDVVVLDADVASSTKTVLFERRFPERFFNVGVAEANMADIAGGLAACGLRPVVSTFALFLTLKAGEQIRNVIAYNNLPVVLMGGYAGLSDSYDGASHQSVLDLAVMRAMPNMAVVVPGDSIELVQALEGALDREGPTYIRVCRNPTPVLFAGAEPFQLGKIRRLRAGADVTVAVCGVPTVMAMEAADRLEREGVSVDLLEVSTLKPLDASTLIESASRTGRVLTVEEHTIYGGLGSAVAEVLGREMPSRLDYIGIEDRFPESGEYGALMRKYGISTDHIAEMAIRLVRGESR